MCGALLASPSSVTMILSLECCVLMRKSRRRAAFREQVVLGVAVLLDDGLDCQQDNFLLVGMHQYLGNHLVGMTQLASLTLFLQAAWAVNVGRTEIAGAINSQ